MGMKHRPSGLCQAVAMKHPLCLGFTLGTVSDTTVYAPKTKP